MKTALLVILLLTGCASKCKDCLTLTTEQLGAGMEAAYIKGFRDALDAVNRARLKAL